jgi:hypothetical protein
MNLIFPEKFTFPGEEGPGKNCLSGWFFSFFLLVFRLGAPVMIIRNGGEPKSPKFRTVQRTIGLVL